MKAASDDLINLLGTSRQIVFVDTYTFTLNGGSTLRYRGGVRPPPGPACLFLVHGDNNFLDYGTLGLTPVPVGAPSFGTGQYSSAVAFSEGSANYISYTASGGVLPDPYGDFTIECWVKILQNDACALSGGYAENRDEFVRLFKAPQVGYVKRALSASCTSGAQKINWASGSAGAAAWTQSQWNHVAECRLNGLVSRYLNGVFVGSNNDTTAWDFDTIQIGNVYLDPSNNVGGLIEEVRILDGAAYTGNTYTVPSAPFPNP
jgi:hypothetical protein